jgi:hypothetical protein
MLGQAEAKVWKIFGGVPPDEQGYARVDDQCIENVHAPLVVRSITSSPEREVNHAIHGTDLDT